MGIEHLQFHLAFILALAVLYAPIFVGWLFRTPPIGVKMISDPDRMISHIVVAFQSRECIILVGDTTTSGKRAELFWMVDWKFLLDGGPDGGHQAVFELTGIPDPESWMLVSDWAAARYTFFIALLRRETLRPGRDGAVLYTMPDVTQ